MDCSWIAHTAHGLLILLMECSWSPWEGVGECKVLLDWKNWLQQQNPCTLSHRSRNTKVDEQGAD